MNSGRQNFWHWYWHREREPGFLRPVPRYLRRFARWLLLLVCAAAYYHFGWRNVPEEDKQISLLLLRNPFVLLAFVGLYLQYLALDYFRYMIHLKTNVVHSLRPSEQHRVALHYRELYGPDFYFRVYPILNWSFLVLFLVGGIMWMFQLESINPR